uniref:Small ribosomal subunit protein mS31 n=1 Tax=Timema bartmani TaxID=61472 RepID=A0A7R9F1C1_9NEOP|nr:unnamed protein product [Timema bartmani]
MVDPKQNPNLLKQVAFALMKLLGGSRETTKSHFKSQCVPSQMCKVSTSSHCFEKHNDDSESSDEDKEKPKKQPGKNMDAINKLNSLLKSMMEEESSPTKSIGASNIEIAQPRFKNKRILESKDKSKEEVKKVLSESEKLDEALTSAAHDVATSFGGNVKQTESELLHKLLSRSESKPSNVKETAKPSVSLNELIVGMKIDRTKRSDAIPEENRAGQVRRILGTRFQPPSREIPYETTLEEKTQELRRPKICKFIGGDIVGSKWSEISGRAPPQVVGRRMSTPAVALADLGTIRSRAHSSERVNLFDSPPLGIFQPSDKTKPASEISLPPELTTWQRLHERELKLAVTHPPANIYEEMIQWTEQGKLWKFPIDNEQGLDEESKVFFTEHIFLEQHIESWCPKRGPVRHFMELVCVGLSKNPYITVQDKKDHLDWFRQYFESKKEILTEVGALAGEAQPQTSLEF